MTCSSCVHHVEQALTGVPGVETATVNLATEKAEVLLADPSTTAPQDLVNAVRNAGYDATIPRPRRSAADEGAAILGLAYGPGPVRWSALAQLALALPVYA